MAGVSEEQPKPRRTPIGLALFWIGAGVNHFLVPRFYEPMVPPPLDRAAGPIIKLSGVAEIAVGAAALAPATRRASGPAMIALLVAVFPANLYMALKPERFSRIPRWALIARLPLQGVAARWAWRATRS